MKDVGVVIPAGGAGKRLGSSVPKAFVPLLGKPLLQHAVERFLSHPSVTTISVALPADLVTSPPEWLQNERIILVQGGAERMDSVRIALAHLPKTTEVVLIHDAARPLVTHALIDRVVNAVNDHTGAIAALPASDTMHLVDTDGSIVSTPARESLWRAQTPQGFPYAMIVAAHQKAAGENRQFTDDAALVVHYGAKVRVVEGDASNLKVTVASDLLIAERFFLER